MKHIILFFAMFLLITLHGNGQAAESDAKKEWRSNFMYGTDDAASPDYKRLMLWVDKVTGQLKALIKEVIGVDTYNGIGNTLNRFVEAVKRFFTQSWDKRMEWKL
ncbi:MAG: hypothetical protein H7838_09070 [Magnetococcus sp. DMHC-8]